LKAGQKELVIQNFEVSRLREGGWRVSFWGETFHITGYE